MTELSSFVQGLPKAELHLHIEGTLEPELRFRLAERNKIALPFADVDEMRASYVFDDLTSFLVVYYDAMSVLQTPQDFYDLAWAYLERAASENVRYAEIFFDPQAHTSRGVPFHNVITGLRGAVNDARRLGIRAQLIMCILRDHSASYAMATLLESLPYKDSIVAVGLDSDERDNPPERFADVFRRARFEGYHLTMHCDVDQESSTEHIRQCLEVIDVERIDHGVNVLEDDALVTEASKRGLGFTVCPVSNRFVTGDLKVAELKEMLDRGLRVTVNSDDPAYFAAYVSDNLVTAAEAGQLSSEELVRLERNAFEVSWLASGPKEALLAELDRYEAMAHAAP
ncbi:MAG TPA: adenosine deaminase [Acidimicrobiales bacterium]|nr:adenosine deaminase [Acidimicrobiales bacterium]